ncbi:MAG: hypothetical protein AAFN74_12195, partial [Myxococcota bacterium]
EGLSGRMILPGGSTNRGLDGALPMSDEDRRTGGRRAGSAARAQTTAAGLPERLDARFCRVGIAWVMLDAVLSVGRCIDRSIEAWPSSASLAP